MKFTKFGKALLMSALSAGVILGVTSCVQGYSVGFLYVTGTVTAQTSGNGIITGFKIDHNTGKLTSINGLPTSSGGANPVRAVLITGSRFLYVLNRGVNASGGSVCTTADPCKNSNITEFAIGGNGILTPQATFFTQGINPFRMIGDTTGNYLLVLDHDSPSDATCKLALGASATTCGDITILKVDQTTGRLTLVINAQVTAANGQALTYFPVPANPIDFLMASGYVLTVSGTPATGDSVFPYTYAGSSGQLTVNQNSSQPLNISQATAIVSASNFIYVLDNEPVTIASGGTFPAGTYPSQILPFTVGSNGGLQAQTGGIIPDDSTLANPNYLISKGSFVYVSNQGNNVAGPNAQSGLAGYFISTSPSFALTFIAKEPWGTGAGPQCLVEDPSNQFIYTANFNDSTVTGHVVDPNSGVLSNLPHGSSFPLTGPATWCVVDGRTN
jgi:6-phosphogluconolactonase